MTIIQCQKEVIEQVLTYLHRRPYQEVAELIEKITTTSELVEVDDVTSRLNGGPDDDDDNDNSRIPEGAHAED